MKARKAIVLAAGMGTRLRPLTCITPKPLMPVWGESMLGRIVARLRAMGVEEITVNCHYLHEQVEAWCAENGCRVSYEPEILGTGGVLNPLREWIGNEPFYLVNGDIVLESEKQDLGLELSDKDEIIGVALAINEGPRTIEVEPEYGYVTNWKSPDPGWDGTYTYCGFALLKPAILNYVEPLGFSSIVQAYERAMMEGHFVKAVMPDDLMWTDAGTIESYIELNCDNEDNALADIPQLKALGAEKVKFLSARGSERAFFRMDKGIAIIYDDSKRGENARYAGHAKWLKAQGVSVPKVIKDLPELKTTLFEFAGIERKMPLEDYVKVVEALVRFNALGGAADLPELEPAFDDKLWQWERELFKEYCLGEIFQLECSKQVEDELKNVASFLEQEPKSLVHRDFQSTNILWKGSELAFIDFQGMRLGPGIYDLASLVYDPYIEFSEGERRALIALYAKKAGRPEIVNILPYAAVQRLVQCLGAYGRLASVGQRQFLKHIPKALENLLDAADNADLDAIGGLAEELIHRCTHKHHGETGHDCNCGCHNHH